MFSPPTIIRSLHPVSRRNLTTPAVRRPLPRIVPLSHSCSFATSISPLTLRPTRLSSRCKHYSPLTHHHVLIRRPFYSNPHSSLRYLYPERLLIYHAGTARTTFLAALKMTTIFVFGFFCLIVTPSYAFSPTATWLQTLGIAACGLIPFAAVAYSTAPMVTYLHLRLPGHARMTKEALEKFVRSGVSAKTELEVSSMTMLARPKQTSVRVGDVMPVSKEVGANYVLVPGATSMPGPMRRKAGKLFRSKPLQKFNIQGFNREARDGWAWVELSRQIERRAEIKGLLKD